MITPVFALRAYRARNDDVALNSTSWIYAQDTAWTQVRDTPFRLRVHVAETAGGEANNVDWTIQYSVNGGAWTALGGLITLSPNFADLDAITPSQLTSPGGSFIGGVGQEVSPSTYRTNHVGSDYAEIEYNLLLPNTLANGDTVTFRALANAATTTSGVTPTLTVSVPSVTYDGTGSSTSPANELGSGEQVLGGTGSDASLASESGAAQIPGNVITYDGTGSDASLVTESGSATVSDFYASVVSSDTPSAWWRFTETSGLSVADEVGTNDLTISGANLDTTGAVGSGVSFDGTNDSAESGSGLWATGATSLSVEAWLKASAWSTAAATPDSVFLLWVDESGNLAFQVRDSTKTTWAVASTSTPSTNEWHHVVGVWDRVEQKALLYLDGELVNSSAVQSFTDIGALTEVVQVATDGGTAFSAIEMDELAIYDSALLIVDVQAHYAAGGGLHYPGDVAADSPSLWYRFSETSGSSVADSIGTNDGAVTGTYSLAADGTGPTGSAIDFTDGLVTSAGLGLNGEHDLTVEAWLNLDAAPTPTETPDSVFLLWKDTSGNLAFQVRDSAKTTWAVASTSMPSLGSWHHVVGVWNRTEKKAHLYLNGSLVNSSAEQAFSNIGALSEPLLVGDGQDGRTDEVALYTTALSASRVSQHYLSGAPALGYAEATGSSVSTVTESGTPESSVFGVGSEPSIATESGDVGSTLSGAGSELSTTAESGQASLLIETTGSSDTSSTQNSLAEADQSSAGSDTSNATDTGTVVGSVAGTGTELAVATEGGVGELSIPASASDSSLATESGSVLAIRPSLASDTSLASESGLAERVVGSIAYDGTGSSLSLASQSSVAEYSSAAIADDSASASESSSVLSGKVALGSSASLVIESGSAERVAETREGIGTSTALTSESSSPTTLALPTGANAASITESSVGESSFGPTANGLALSDESSSATSLREAPGASTSLATEAGAAERVAETREGTGTSTSLVTESGASLPLFSGVGSDIGSVTELATASVDLLGTGSNDSSALESSLGEVTVNGSGNDFSVTTEAGSEIITLQGIGSSLAPVTESGAAEAEKEALGVSGSDAEQTGSSNVDATASGANSSSATESGESIQLGTLVLVPDGASGATNIVNEVGGTENLHLSVDDAPGSPDDDSTYIVNLLSESGSVMFGLESVPPAFGVMDSLRVTIRARGVI